MKALYFDNGLRFIPDYPKAEPGPGEALIRIQLAGICNTDLEIVKGYMGFRGILGHEFVGLVQSSPEPDWIGKRVVGEINASCGHCDYCLKGLDRHCPNRTVLGIQGRNGAFAEYLCLPIQNLHPVPDSVSNREAVFAEPVAAACEIFEQVLFEPGTPVAVLGDGKLGLLICQVLAAHRLDVTLVGHHPGRVEKAVKTLSFFKLEEEIEGAQFPVVVEATGNAAGLVLAQKLIEPRGTIVLKSTIAGRTEVNTTQLVVDEIRMIGSRCGPFEPALKLIREKKILVEGMIDACYPLEEGQAAFKKAKQPGVCKVLLQPES